MSVSRPWHLLILPVCIALPKPAYALCTVKKPTLAHFTADGTAIADYLYFTDALTKYYDQHDCYSQDYLSDWDPDASPTPGLGTADELTAAALTLPAAGDWTDVITDGVISASGGERWYNVTGASTTLSGTNTRTYTQTYLHIDGDVTADDIHWEVDWPAGQTKDTATNLISVHDVEYVLIENLYIQQLDSSVITKNVLTIDGCDTAIIRNSYFAGPAEDHIQIQGCKRVFIDTVEIAGLDNNANGLPSLGGGITISNCNSKGIDNTDRCEGFSCPELTTDCLSGEYAYGTYSCDYTQSPPAPSGDWKGCDSDESGVDDDADGVFEVEDMTHDLSWLVIQNVYIHDAAEAGSGDAIAIESPGDGVLFNTVVESWASNSAEGVDGAFDIDHRRFCDPSYKSHLFRIERNMLLDAGYIKTPGLSNFRNTLLYVNNLFHNTGFNDYHRQHNVFYLHNTIMFDDDSLWSKMYELNAYYEDDSDPLTRHSQGHSTFFNNAVYLESASGRNFKFYNTNTSDGGYHFSEVWDTTLNNESGDSPREGDLLTAIRSDYNDYIIDSSGTTYYWSEVGGGYQYTLDEDGTCETLPTPEEHDFADSESDFASWQIENDTNSDSSNSPSCFSLASPPAAWADFQPDAACTLLSATTSPPVNLFALDRDFVGQSRDCPACSPVVGAFQD